MAKKFLRLLTIAALIASLSVSVRAADAVWSNGVAPTDFIAGDAFGETNVLTLDSTGGTLFVDGNIFIDSTRADVTVVVGANGEVTVEPVITNTWGNLVFYAPESTKIDVEVVNGNLYFEGNPNSLSFMYVTFVGAGQTTFKIDGGLNVTFGANGGYGTTVFVDMDQMPSEVEAGNNKVVFQRYLYTDAINFYDKEVVDVWFE